MTDVKIQKSQRNNHLGTGIVSGTLLNFSKSGRVQRQANQDGNRAIMQINWKAI